MECPGFSTIYRSGVATSTTGSPRVDVEEVVLLGGFNRPVLRNLAALSEHLEGTHGHGGTIDMEEPSGSGTGIREAEPVGTQGGIIPRYLLSDLVGDLAHIVGSSNDRTRGLSKTLNDVRSALALLRVQEGLLLGIHGITT